MRISALLLMLLTWCGCESPKREQPQTPSALEKKMTPIPVFSGERAFRHLVRQTEFGPRNPNSKGHRECREYLTQTLRSLADEVQVQPFSTEGYAEVLALTNILAKFNVSAKSRILLCAHWDTRPRADQDTTQSKRNDPIIGANDGASGAAVLLEIAALLKQQAPPVGVDIALFDGEDYGTEGDLTRYFLGSRYFAANKPADYNPRFGILLDMVGDTFLELRREQHSVRFAPDIVALVWRKAKELGYSQFVDELGEEINDDHLPLNAVGIKTIDLIDFDYPDPTNRYWHTHDDTPDKCSPASLEAVGTVVTHIVYTQAPVP